MAEQTKRWTGLGIAALLASTAALSACGEVEQIDTKTETKTQGAGVAAGGEGGEGTEGGEGEGGVSIAAAATSPVVYQSALAIAKAHVFAARDAHAAGEINAAGEMFSHPASEVMYDMEPILQARGVALFSNLFTDTSDAVFAGETPVAIAKRSAKIIDALNAAATKSPTDGTSAGRVAAGVVADQIDRAADMYRIAKDTGEYGPYLDGYGFYKAAADAYEAGRMDIAGQSATLIAVIEGALAQLDVAYPTATMPKTLTADPAALRAVSSRLMLGLS